jgi:hypothetical protein
MAIEKTPGGSTMITGDDVGVFRLLALKSALKLEMRGLHRRGPSAYSIIKSEFKWKGNRQKILDKLEAHLEEIRKQRSEA